MSPTIESTKVADFTHALEKKQEVWHEMMTISTRSRYYNPAWRPSTYRLHLPSQADVFFRYQSQHQVPQSQQPWRPFERGSELGQLTPSTGSQCQYSQQSWQALDRPLDVTANGPRHYYLSQPLKQTFMPQRQYYPTNDQRYQAYDQRYQKLSLLIGANCDTTLRSGQITQSIPYAPNNATNCPHTALYQAVPHQPYQSRQFQHVYHYAKEKRIYRVDNKPLEELKEDLPDSETYYTNELYNKLPINFVRIELVYDRCITAFPS